MTGKGSFPEALDAPIEEGYVVAGLDGGDCFKAGAEAPCAGLADGAGGWAGGAAGACRGCSLSLWASQSSQPSTAAAGAVEIFRMGGAPFALPPRYSL